jgi:hypothetical protein
MQDRGPLEGCLLVAGFGVLSTVGILGIAFLDRVTYEWFPELATVAAPGAPIAASDIQVGMPVWVEWHETWYESVVREIAPDRGEILIHYEGFADQADERVAPSRVRRR